MATKKEYLSLFKDFLQFGCFTFGGGMSIVAQMNSEYVQRRGVLSNEELLDLTGVARSLPGIMVCNVAMLFGYRSAGILGGALCVLGMCLPPMVILSLITGCYTLLQNNPWVMAAMQGIRAAIAPIILSSALTMIKGAYRYKIFYGVSVLTAVLYLFFHVSPVLLVLLGAASGLVVCEIMERRANK